jgi:L,D-peptidoglycan transpeptidase YkuD (ErfK/YbiS/YcfS/YnhG family)
MNTHAKPSFFLHLNLSCLCLLAASLINAETTTTTTTVTNPDGSTTETVQETSTEPAAAETAPPTQSSTPNLIGPTGATGVIRRSDRRQDRREGDPRIDR